MKLVILKEVLLKNQLHIIIYYVLNFCRVDKREMQGGLKFHF